MRNLFVKAALVLCTTIIFLPATVFATEPQNTEITSAEEGFTDSDPSVSYENDNSLTLDEKEDESTSTEPPSTEPPAEDEKTPDKADTDKENPDPDIFTSGDDFGDGSKSNPFHVVIDSDNPEDGDAPQITDPVIDNGGYSGGGGGGNSTSDSSSEKILHKPQVLLEDSNLSGGRLEAGSTTEMSLTGLQKGKYSLTEYKVTAANESGAASAATSNSVILGDALAMPFKESFDGGTCQHTWFMGAAWATFTAGNDPKTQDADGTSGLISFCCYSTNVAKGTVSTIVSPAIAVGGQQAYFNFSVYHYSGTFATEDSLTPCAIAADGSVQTLGDPIMRDNGTTGWKEYSYPLSGNVVCVALKGYSDYGYNIHVDRIAVSTEQSGVSAVEIADNALVTVYNLSGARVAERMQRSDVSTLAPGCYIVRSATATEKVIVR